MLTRVPTIMLLVLIASNMLIYIIYIMAGSNRNISIATLYSPFSLSLLVIKTRIESEEEGGDT